MRITRTSGTTVAAAIDKARYYDVQLIDHCSYNYGYVGSRATGNGAGCFLVAGPDRKGKDPPGVVKAFTSGRQLAQGVHRW